MSLPSQIQFMQLRVFKNHNEELPANLQADANIRPEDVTPVLQILILE